MNFLPREILVYRSGFIKSIRTFFEKNGFLEIDTPVLVESPGMEPYLNPYSVVSPEQVKEGYLVTSPEYSLKQALATGIEKVYELSHSFRSGEKGGLHTKEFLMLEFYEANKNEQHLIDTCIYLLEYLNQNFFNFNFQKEKCIRITMEELFYLKTGCSLKREDLIEFIHKNLNGYLKDVESAEYEDLFYLIFLNYVERDLPHNIVFIYDYPPEMAALSKVIDGKAKRFEIYWNGIELGNAFYELTDGKEQLNRFYKEQELRRKLGKEVFEINQDFQKTLEMGIPESSGIAIGADRLLMLILGEKSLRWVSPYYTRDLHN